jgi:hypothetical protein
MHSNLSEIVSEAFPEGTPQKLMNGLASFGGGAIQNVDGRWFSRRKGLIC